MKRIFFALLGLAAFSLPAAAFDISGKYVAKGTNFDGSTYEGTAEIAKLSNTTCVVVWKIAGREYDGICMKNKDGFAAAYEMDGQVGLLLYRMEADGSLEGTWTITGERGAGTEVLIPAN